MNTDMMIAELVEAELQLPEPERSLLFKDLLFEMYQNMSEEDLVGHWNHVYGKDQ